MVLVWERMNNHSLFLCTVLIAIVFSTPLAGQQAAKIKSGSESAASPEMNRLAKALAGDWKTVETMEHGEFFPNGGSRHGVVHARLAAGGNVLIYEVHSNGSAGKLDGFHTIWWDKDASLYYFFACFNDPTHPCRMRGTANWEGDTFVNNYEEMVDGKKTQWRGSLTFSPPSPTLVSARDPRNGTIHTLIPHGATP